MDEYRRGMMKAAEIAESEKVDSEATGEETDKAYNSACDHIAAAIRAQVGEEECCEWSEYPPSERYGIPSCGGGIEHISDMRRWEHCPHCGRKIRIKGE